MKYRCACCGYITLTEKPPGTFEICEICYWEDDNVQFENPDYEGGANRVSLRHAQKNFLAFGASEEIFLDRIREIHHSDIQDSTWKALS